MPTKPVEQLLHRELSKAAAKAIIDNASPLLRELVDYSLAAYLRCRDSIADKYEKDAAPNLYLHLIEMIDGVELHVAQACSIPAVPVVRSAFEALLGIEYMFEVDYDQRWLAFYVMQLHNHLRDLERFDPSTPTGQEFQLAWNSDQALKTTAYPKLNNLQKEITDQKQLLADPTFTPVLAQITGAKTRYQKWYSLAGGPSSVGQLADHLDRKAQYLVLYHYWSTIGHSENVMRFPADMTKTSMPGLVLRNPDDLREVVTHASNIMIAATLLMLRRFRFGEADAFRRWYVSEVRPRYLGLAPEIN